MEDGSGQRVHGEAKSTLTLSITGPYEVFGPVAINWIVVVGPVAVNWNTNGAKNWLADAPLNGAVNTWFTSDPAETTPVLV